MTRQVLFGGLVLAACAAAPTQDKKDVPKDLEPFQGTWKVAKLQVAGQDNAKGDPTDQQFTFAGDKLTVRAGKEVVLNGTVSVSPKKDPAELDLVFPKGGKMPWIYKFDKDGKLTVCFELALGGSGKDKEAPRPKSFDTKGTANVLLVLEKAKE